VWCVYRRKNVRSWGRKRSLKCGVQMKLNGLRMERTIEREG